MPGMPRHVRQELYVATVLHYLYTYAIGALKTDIFLAETVYKYIPILKLKFRKMAQHDLVGISFFKRCWSLSDRDLNGNKVFLSYWLDSPKILCTV